MNPVSHERVSSEKRFARKPITLVEAESTQRRSVVPSFRETDGWSQITLLTLRRA
jgi:hypothetical protein